MEKITKNMMIDEVIRKYPIVAEELFNLGIHCIGCYAMNIETLEQGLKGHGLKDKEVSSLIKKLNTLVKKKSKKVYKD